MLNDKISTLKIRLWFPFTAAYNFFPNLFRAVASRDLHERAEVEGGFLTKFRGKKRRKRHLTQNFSKLRIAKNQ